MARGPGRGRRADCCGGFGEAEVLARLRAGDERAFESLLESYHGTMIAVALSYVRTRDVAEEVVQQAWLAVLKGLDRFEERSSLKTWIMRILVDTAMTRSGISRISRSCVIACRESGTFMAGPGRPGRMATTRGPRA